MYPPLPHSMCLSGGPEMVQACFFRSTMGSGAGWVCPPLASTVKGYGRRACDRWCNRRGVNLTNIRRASDWRSSHVEHEDGEGLPIDGLGSADLTPEWAGGSALTRTDGRSTERECRRVEYSIPQQVKQQGALAYAPADTIMAVLLQQRRADGA